MSLLPEDRRARALREVAARRPSGLQSVITLELSHPALPEPVRVVADNADLVARLETDVVVTFQAVAFQASLPQQVESRWPEIELRIDGAAGIIEPYLEATMALDAPISVTFREYLRERADDGPGRVIKGLELSRTKADDLSITGTAGFYGLDRQFGTTYDPQRYPGIA